MAKDYSRQIYADFESLLERPQDDGNILQVHLPIAAACLTLGPNDRNGSYHQFYGTNCAVDFLQYLGQLARDVQEWYDTFGKQPMNSLDDVEKEFHLSAFECYLCKKRFDPTNNRHKVCDHDHFTGHYLGPACNKCNLARRIRKPILPVVFHNFRGYDAHHLLKYAVNEFPDWEFGCIAQSSERFQSLTVHIKDAVIIRFIDSLQFLSSSLSNLVAMLNPEDKRYINSLDLPDEARSGKGIFPYSFITSQAVLEEERDALPDRAVAFHDILADSVTVTEAEYARAQTIWRLCGCRTLKDYMLMYLKVDVYLLADVFETFRKTALKEDELDPANFFGIPGLSWCSALKSMSRELELLQDLSMYDYFEAGVRGGMTFVNQHYARHDDSTELLYIDINNLYGWALSQYLPARNFHWITDDAELSVIMSQPLPDENSTVGYVLEVDMSIPVEFHDRLSDLPPAPLSQIPPGSKVKKLLLSMEPKTHYVIHSALLKFYVEVIGIKVDKVHRAIGFTQEQVFCKYIAMNTEKRAKSTTKFEKDYYKLKNNALYGKTVENLRKRKDVRLCNTRQSFIAQSSKPCFRRSIIIKENLVAAILNKETIMLDRPVYIGQAVLDLSKLRMYRLQYVDLQRYREQYAGCTINIVAGDTDSFFLEVKGVSLANQLLPQMRKDCLLDTSNYPTDSVLFSRQFENKIGLFKDESGGKDVYKEWVFLRPKCYSMLCEDNSSSHKAKGVKRGTELQHEQYLNIYKSFHPDIDSPPSPKRHCVDQRRIGSVNHDIFTTRYRKLALSINDDKRAWIGQNSSLPYGHYRLP